MIRRNIYLFIHLYIFIYLFNIEDLLITLINRELIVFSRESTFIPAIK